MRISSLAIIVCLLGVDDANACLNTYEEELRVLMHRDDRAEIAGEIAQLEAEYAKSPSVELANDLAVLHVVSGNYEKAVLMLRDLEKEHPGHSKTASNLGTALELSGKDTEALQWIKEGIARDPKDHDGTEWLHVKILDAKLALANDPNWLRAHSVLGIDFGTDAEPRNPETSVLDHLGVERSVEDALVAIRYQLFERLQFVTVPDPVVGDLFFARGDIGYLLRLRHPTDMLPNEYYPADYYEAALKFGVENQALVKLRLKRAMNYFRSQEEKELDELLENVVAALSFLAIGIGLLLYRRFRRRHTVQGET